MRAVSFLARAAAEVGVAALIALGAAAFAAAPAGGAGAGAEPLRVELRARAIAPGEPVRIVVVAPRPLASLVGTFLGRPLFFVHESSEARDETQDAAAARRPPRENFEAREETWSAFALVGLDDKARRARAVVRARDARGRALAGAASATVETRRFPEERITVEPKYVEPPADVMERIRREQTLLAKVYAARRAAAPEGPFVRPVAGEKRGVFGGRRVFNGQPRAAHGGIDLAAPTGTPVAAAGAGKVVVAQDLYFSGNTVVLDHGGGLFTIYAHFSRIDVAVGAEVARGATLGLSGATGRVTGPHVHWGAKVGAEPFDPEALLSPDLFR
ncbi:MAG: M23 family metallopeptidase [Candidatus Polarisedimenticolia bacterium]